MPCPHKFQRYLNLENLTFQPTTLILGTFNPAWPKTNPAQWFYGRTQNNNFWEVLPRLYGEASLINAGPQEWKSFCERRQIAITDLIANIQDAEEDNGDHHKLLGGYADEVIANSFYDFDLVNIVRLLRNRPTITQVYTTRSTGQTFWSHKVYPVKTYCAANRISLKPLITPSGFAYRQQGRHNRQHPENILNLADYILMRWQQEWHLL